MDYFEQIDAMGGMVAAIERGFPMREIAEASYQYQMAVDAKEKIIVGVNDFVTKEKEAPIELLQISDELAQEQTDQLNELRRTRDSKAVSQALTDLKAAARDKQNTMPATLEAVKAYATLGEICDTFRDTFGAYEETTIT